MSNIRLEKGDCLKIMDQLISEGIQVDAIITDPPYGTTACKWDNPIPFDEMWDKLNKLIKPNGAIVLFGSEPFSSKLRISNIENYRYDWIWDKVLHSNPLIAKKQPLSAHENISVFYKKQPIYNPQMTEGKEVKRGGVSKKKCETKGNANIKRGKSITKERYPKKILTISNANKTNIVHPTQKPVGLMEYLVKTYTNEGDIVLDFTMGSGSTGVACKNLNRDFIGIELDETYFNIAKDRMK